MHLNIIKTLYDSFTAQIGFNIEVLKSFMLKIRNSHYFFVNTLLKEFL